MKQTLSPNRQPAARWLWTGLLLLALLTAATPIMAAPAPAPAAPDAVTNQPLPVDTMLRLLAADGIESDMFGESVGVSGNTYIVGTPFDDTVPDKNDGSAYVYVSNGVMTQQAKLTASDGGVTDRFGTSVAIDGDTAIVGAWGDESAYIFVRNGTTWTQQQKLTAGNSGNWFGLHVALAGDTAIVGAVLENLAAGSHAGSAYIFVRNGTTWTQQAQLTAADATADDLFGWSVAIGGDTAIVGAVGDTPFGFETGSAYVFVRSGSTWMQQQKLIAADASSDDRFGSSVALAGDTAIVGAIEAPKSANITDSPKSGAAYVFARSGTTWTQQQRLIASDAAADDYFGASIAVSGDTALIGATGNDDLGESSGSVYVFARSGTTWTENRKLTAPDGAALDEFGNAVAISGEGSIIGAHGNNTLGGDAGSAYTVLIPQVQLWLDVDGDGVPDGNEDTYTGPIDMLTYVHDNARMLATQTAAGSMVKFGATQFDLAFRVPVAADWSTGAPVTGMQTVRPSDSNVYRYGIVPWVSAQSIAGIVYDDYDADGIFDFANWGSDRFLPEPGLAGVTVTAYAPGSATAVASAVTDTQGRYRLDLAASTAAVYRLEFTNLPAGYSPSVIGTDNPTTVAFAGKNSNVNFGVYEPANYFGAARLVTTRTLSDPAELLRFEYMATNGDAPVPTTTLAQESALGNTYGLAWQASSDTLFAGAFFGGLGSTYGSSGGGAIYGVDNAYSRTTAGGALFVNLDDYGIATGPDNTGTCVITPQGGIGCFHDVGSRGLGDLDLSPDGATLYVVSPFADQMVRLAIGSPPTAPASADTFTVPRPANCPTDLDFIPSALGVAPNGKVYVGATCIARSTQAVTNLRGYVYEWDPVAAFPAAPVLDFPLNYPRQTMMAPHVWQPWAPVSANFARVRSPLLSDIDFHGGDLVLTIADTVGFAVDSALFGSMGDILRACYSGGAWALENAGVCGTLAAHPAGTANNDGPGNGEYYWDDEGGDNDATSTSLSTLPRFRNVAFTALDLFGFGTTYFAHGVGYLDQRTGKQDSKASYLFQLRPGSVPIPLKAAATGDLETLLGPPATEVGNRVWEDANADGIQDPGETSIDGLQVTLTCGADSATTTTANGGQYRFSNKTGGNALFMGANEACTLSVATSQTALTGMLVTTADAPQPANGNAAATDNHPITDVADSDAALSGANAVITFTTGESGQNNHSLDFGFKPDMDFGDLPDAPYATLKGSNGPFHLLSSTLYLGACVDGEGNGRPNQMATGDDRTLGSPTYGTCSLPNDDEDGIALVRPLVAGSEACVAVTAVSSAAAILNGWIDFTGNGSLADASDALVFTKVDGTAITPTTNGPVTAGGFSERLFCFNVPATAPARLGSVAMRFRLSTTGGLQPTGIALDGEVEDYMVPLGAIGNYVWVDENSDGYQDAGERGLPNVRINLYDTAGNIVATTYTDSRGGYQFISLPPGSYFVRVDATTIPAGMTQTPPSTLPGADFGNQDQATGANDYGYPVTIGGAQPLENLTADFGYNHNPAEDVNNPSTGSATAALGDRVWLDADGDGQQDANEIGVRGVTVQLFTSGPDGIFGTGDDLAGAAAVTDANGYYLFDDLAPGAYVVKVVSSSGASHDVLGSSYTQTGDPDHFAATGAVNDNLTTAPVLLGPGDVFLNADFGYRSITGVRLGSVGGGIWFDPTASGMVVGDRIPGVTVALIRDTNGDGIWDADGADNIHGTADDEPVIATTTTNATSTYLFTGLALSDSGDGNANDADYIVWVNDAESVLTGMRQTYDQDSPLDNRSAATISSSTYYEMNQDFVYTSAGQQPSTSPTRGLIGDTVWFDLNNSGGATQGSEPGIEGVAMELLDASGNVITTTTTDENGHYYFGGLPVSAGGIQYRVRVAASNFAAGGVLQGMAETFAAGATVGGHLGNLVSLTTASPINLDQDLSYTTIASPGRIGNLVWLDANADGLFIGVRGPDNLPTTDDDEPVLGGVTLDLYRDLDANGRIDPGEPRISTQTTASAINAGAYGADGAYIFSRLPAGAFVVNVTDSAGRLAGYWHSLGAAGANNNSQDDPYAVTLAAGADNLTADFGYYVEPAALGNFVWLDRNGDGLQNTGEPGINGVTLQLTIAWPAGGSAALRVVSGDNPNQTGAQNGWYSFGNLLLDEDYRLGSSTSTPAANQPAHVIAVASPPAGYIPTTIGGADGNEATAPLDDSNNPAGVVGVPVQGLTDTRQQTATSEPSIAAYDFGYYLDAPGAIGNRVWVDENSDGYQDAGEPGLPNVRVNLYDTAGSIIATTVTDSRGGYLFGNLPPGSYFVRVDATTLPTGMTQTTTYTNPGADFGNQDQSTGAGDYGYPVTVGGVQPLENLTADFGYNYNPADDVNNPSPGATAALGDRVWIDFDGDGRQDPDEGGVRGVTVQLFTPGPDGIFGTGDDLAGATAVTDANGSYVFDGLAPGPYVVRVMSSSSNASHDILGSSYTQTGDPDHFGATGAVNDNRTTAPVLLAPGDVFLNADFGYQPNAGLTLGTIGDTVWFDADASGTATMDVSEVGIPGVTVALIRDINGNGSWDAGEPIIATDATDANGSYLFQGLSLSDAGDGAAGDADYIVWVNDTDAVLTGLRQTYDQDSPLDHRSATALSSSTTSDLTQDFSYAPLAHSNVAGLIGDTVWFDLDNSGGAAQQTGEPGIEGVIVELLDASSSVIAATATDENGRYDFGGLPVSAGGVSYQTRVAASNFAAGGVLQGMAETFAAGATVGGHLGNLVTLTSANPRDLLQDFSYTTTDQPGRLGNLVWLDANADGLFTTVDGPDGLPTTDDDEPVLGGVTLDLYRDLDANGRIDPGEPRISTQTTASAIDAGAYGADGAYIFSRLPAGAFVVNVTDRAGLLAGYWHSLGAAGTNNNSQDDPYAVTLAAGADNLTADFGYYVEPAALGNFVWLDRNGDGLQTAGEPGIDGVTLQLTIAWPAGGSTMLRIVSADNPDQTGAQNGWYSFGNLLLDEDYRFGSSTSTPAANQPAHVIAVTVPPAGYIPTTIGGADGEEATAPLDDSNNPAGVVGVPVQGLTDTRQQTATSEPSSAAYDFGFAVQDWGDLPDVTPSLGPIDYQTLRLNSGPSHSMVATLRLGACLDAETDGQPDLDPAGDDASGSNLQLNGAAYPVTQGSCATADDEDGIATLPALHGDTTTFQVTVAATNLSATDSATLRCWFDLNHDGAFAAAGEAADALVGPGASNQDFTLTFSGFATPLPTGDTYLRCRIAYAAAEVANPTGAAASGEVEDYKTETSPLAVLLASFTASLQPDHVLVAWETVSEHDNAGFNLYRSLAPDGPHTLLAWIPAAAPGSTLGGIYSFQDADLQPGQTYWYFLADVDLSGLATLHGPVSIFYQPPAGQGEPSALTLRRLAAGERTTPSPLRWGLTLAPLLTLATAVIRRRRAAAV